MANLGYFKFDTNGEYQKLSELTGITFESGVVYTLQLLNPAVLCESSTPPTNGGFYINNSNPIQYKATSSDLYIKTTQGNYTVINIAE